MSERSPKGRTLRKAAVLSLSGALTLAMSACGASGGSNSAANGSGSASPVKIALISAYTGFAAQYGTQMNRAVALAKKNYGSKINGHPIEVSTFDDKCTAAGAAVAVKNALAENPLIVIGPACSGGVAATQKELESAGIPHIVGSYQSSLTSSGDKLIFDQVATNTQLGKAMAAFVKEKGWTRVAILHGTSSFSTDLGTQVGNALSGVGINPVKSISYTDGATDFSGEIQALKGSSPDAVFFAGYDPDEARACAQMKQLGLNAVCLGDEAMTEPDSIAAGGAALNGAFAVTPYIASEFPQFTAAWKTQFGSAPIGESYTLGYPGVVAAWQAIKDAGSNPTSAKIADVLRTKKFTIDLGLGNLKFDKTGNNSCASLYIGEFSNSGKTFTKVKNESLQCS